MQIANTKDESGLPNLGVPYLSVSRLDRVLELAKTRTLNQVSTSMFATYGFNGSDAALAVKLLKFLGAVDEAGNATSVMADLRLESEERRKAAFERIVRRSYARLFDAVKEPYSLPKADLADELRVQYDLSPRVVDSALPAFLRLSELAGLVEAGAVARRSPQKPRAEKKPSVPKRIGAHSPDSYTLKEESSRPGVHVQSIVKGEMSIIISEEAFMRASIDDHMNEAWRKVLKAAHSFAQDYLTEGSVLGPDSKPDSAGGP